MGRLVRLELENFKSYHGRQTIGPFDDNFVSIIGPNGSGKSNLMDALSFVLGISSAHLRSSHLSEVIYRDGEQQASHASVAVVYRRDNGQEATFSRRINAHGQSEYRLDGKIVVYTDYCRLWEEENVLIKARNFLVFQGDVEALASKSPRELARLFEQISGSEEYRSDYDRCKAAFEKATEENTFNYGRRKGLSTELKQVQEQREDVVRYEKLLGEREKIQGQLYLWKLFHVEDTARKVGLMIDDKEVEMTEAEANVQRADAEWKEAKKQQAKEQKELLNVERRLKTAQRQMTDDAPEAVQLGEKIKFAQQRLNTAQESIQSAHDDVLRFGKEIAIAERESAEVLASVQQFETLAAERLAAADIRPELVDEYNQLKALVNERVAKEKLKLESLERKMGPELASKGQLEAKLAELVKAKNLIDTELASLTVKHDKVTIDVDNVYSWCFCSWLRAPSVWTRILNGCSERLPQPRPKS